MSVCINVCFYTLYPHSVSGHAERKSALSVNRNVQVMTLELKLNQAADVKLAVCMCVCVCVLCSSVCVSVCV